ncbi:hypothetical protein BGZ61DRAFT_475219 [Ilyonectria robusta]|uniref:uncharacterized protein n=1 Tax=Ilyonectria robusta TaxID=1079257 RepID=UPI001E8E1C61|nr:uncharacterized protein BGZ61DRAFT_475219 [Ilyonectria robusta]KAH8729634.1 hypothetical protein BGZ61DRAFT_475219 [Ilyonectria robusta]
MPVASLTGLGFESGLSRAEAGRCSASASASALGPHSHVVGKPSGPAPACNALATLYEITPDSVFNHQCARNRLCFAEWQKRGVCAGKEKGIGGVGNHQIQNSRL